MKVIRLGIGWGAAYNEATPVQITHGDATVIIFVSEGGDLVVQTKEGDWKITSAAGGSDVKLTVRS